ncbi:MAG: N-6 DNA methylase, partial [Limisphaerales bacterium]
MACERIDQKLPAVWDEREALRKTGQFWTPPWLAKTMAAWVTANSPPVLFDPAVGPGTFFAAARSIGFNGNFAGFELHSQVLTGFDSTILKETDFCNVIQADFLQTPVEGQFPAIISNPPYIRHHRLSKSQKEGLRALSSQAIGFELDGRVGLHVYFLIK